MREEINDSMVEQVNGGRYYLNGNNKKLVFTTMKGTVFTLKGCSDYQAMELMDSLIGKYPTQAEYDQACVNELKKNGWI